MLEAVLLFTFICVALSGIEANRWMVSLPTDRLCVWSGTSAILSCKYDYPYGYGIRRVMWFRHTAEGKREYVFHTDLSVVSPSYMGRTSYSGAYKTCTLQISSVRSTDGGEYYFRFETDRQGGQWTSTDAITLSVTVLQVQVHPARQGNLFASGETVYLGCEAKGCAAPGNQFILYRNTVKLGSANSVTIHNFDTGHSGTYICRLASLPQVHSPGVALAVGYAPRQTTVVISPQGAIMEGSSVTLTCSSNADPAVESYSWFKDQAGWSLPDSFKPQLQLWNTSPSDQGEYYCVARNSLGSQKSPSVLLNITHAPRNTAVVIEPPGDVMEGSSATLVCSSSANPPVMRYTWFVIAATQSLERGSTQNLTFPNVRAHHGGQYYCTVWNKYGHETSAALTLAVLYAPRNTSVSAWPSSEIEAGSSVTLICNSSANPAVENYTWFRINDADSWETRSGPSYTITGITHREGGQYYCEARNKLGTHSSPVLTVRVRGRLKVIALASAVAVSAALVTLTVVIMISKNMHIVETEPAKEEQETSSEQAEALIQGKQQETFQLSTTRMMDIPEELENVYENMHPCIVPMKEATQNSEHESTVSYVTVHFTRLEQNPMAKPPLEGATKPKGSQSDIYSVLARPKYEWR